MQRQDLQNEQARILRTSVDDVLDLPLLSDGIDLGALFELADALEPVVAR